MVRPVRHGGEFGGDQRRGECTQPIASLEYAHLRRAVPQVNDKDDGAGVLKLR